MPNVSVIVPAYNVAPYIDECLTSIVRQTLTRIEIIVVNDCAGDATGTLLEAWAGRDARVRVCSHETNRGLAAARNTGMRAARGEWIFFLDGDDVLARPDALALLYETALADDADQVIGRMLYWRDDTDERSLDWQARFFRKEFHGLPLEKCPEQAANVSACNKLLRRSFLERHAIAFDESLRKHEDNPFSAQVHCLAERSSLVLETTYLYRQRSADTRSIMQTRAKSDVRFYLQVDLDTLRFFQSADIPASKCRIYYPEINWRIEAFQENFAHLTFTNADVHMITTAWKDMLDLVPPRDHAFFSPRTRKAYTLLLQGDALAAWRALEPPRHPPSLAARIRRKLAGGKRRLRLKLGI